MASDPRVMEIGEGEDKDGAKNVIGDSKMDGNMLSTIEEEVEKEHKGRVA